MKPYLNYTKGNPKASKSIGCNLQGTSSAFQTALREGKEKGVPYTLRENQPNEMLTVLRASKVMGIRGKVLFGMNVNEEHPSSVVELQRTQNGGRLLLSSTAIRFKSIQLCGPVLPQQVNCSRDDVTMHLL